MDWVPILQTAVGAFIALVANELLHRRRVSESTLNARREIYTRYLKHIYRVDAAFDPDSREALTRADEQNLIQELHDIMAEIEALGSDRVRKAVNELHELMATLHDPDDIHSQHQDAVRQAIRSDRAETVVESIRADLRTDKG